VAIEMDAKSKIASPKRKLLIALLTLMISVISFVFVLQRSAAGNPRNIAGLGSGNWQPVAAQH